MRLTSTPLRWTAAGAVVAAGVAALLLLPSALAPSGPSETTVGAAAGGTAQGPPSFELVQQLRAELTASAADNPDYPIDPSEAALVATAPQEYTPLGQIRIERIGLDVAYAAGVHPSVLEEGPGHWPGSATPGQPGNAVLSGHRTTYTQPFRNLDELDPGDPIEVTPTGTAAPVVYRVTETEVVLEEDYRDAVLAPPASADDAQLVLFACHPEGDYSHRILVRAVADPSEPSGGGS